MHCPVSIPAFPGTLRCLRPTPATWSVPDASSEQEALEEEEEEGTGAATGTTGAAGLSKLQSLLINLDGSQVEGLRGETEWAAIPRQRA